MLLIFLEAYMKIYVRMNEIYAQLFKSIRDTLISHTIVLKLPSVNATICAFNGMKYTIESIIKELNNVKIEEYSHKENKKEFHIVRSNNIYSTNITLNVYKLEDNKHIEFEFFVHLFN